MASLKTCRVDEMHESLLLMFLRNVFQQSREVDASEMDVVIWFFEGLEASLR